MQLAFAATMIRLGRLHDSLIARKLSASEFSTAWTRSRHFIDPALELDRDVLAVPAYEDIGGAVDVEVGGYDWSLSVLTPRRFRWRQLHLRGQRTRWPDR